jgi:hypothetical protein
VKLQSPAGAVGWVVVASASPGVLNLEIDVLPEDTNLSRISFEIVSQRLHNPGYR